MSPEEALSFQSAVLEIVAQIPKGCVTTYGTIAAWAGWPDHARMVGRILRYSSQLDLPFHRVVNAVGRTAPGWLQQRDLLEQECVRFLPNHHVDLRRHLWQPLEE